MTATTKSPPAAHAPGDVVALTLNASLRVAGKLDRRGECQRYEAGQMFRVRSLTGDGVEATLLAHDGRVVTGPASLFVRCPAASGFAPA